jgi:hypothetical protein
MTSGMNFILLCLWVSVKCMPASKREKVVIVIEIRHESVARVEVIRR